MKNKTPKEQYDKMLSDFYIIINLKRPDLFDWKHKHDEDKSSIQEIINDYDKAFKKRIPRKVWLDIFSVYEYIDINFIQGSTVSTNNIPQTAFTVSLKYADCIVYLNIEQKTTMINVFAPGFGDSFVIKNYKKEHFEILDELKYSLELSRL